MIRGQIAIVALTVAFAFPVSTNGQPAVVRAHSVNELREIANITFQSLAADQALRRQNSYQLNQKDLIIRQRDLKISQLEKAGSINRREIENLKSLNSKEKTRFVLELAKKDSEFDRQRQKLEIAASNILQTAEAKQAQKILLSNAPGAEEAAFALFDIAANKGNADNYRVVANLARAAWLQGRLPLESVITRYEKVVSADPDSYLDWSELSSLYEYLNLLDKAEAAAEQAVATAPQDPNYKHARTSALFKLAQILFSRGNLASSLVRYEETLAYARSVVDVDATREFTELNDVIPSLMMIGDILRTQKNLKGALLRYEEALAIARKRVALDATNTYLSRLVVSSLIAIGYISLDRQDFRGALARYEEALSIARTLEECDPRWTEGLDRQSGDTRKIGDGAVQERPTALQGKTLGTELVPSVSTKPEVSEPTPAKSLNEAFAVFVNCDILASHQKSQNNSFTQPVPNIRSATAQRELSNILNEIGDIVASWGYILSAQTLYGYSLTLRRKLAAQELGSDEAQRDISASLAHLGDILIYRQDFDGALSRYEEEMAIRRTLAANNLSSADAQRDYLVSLTRLAELGAKGHSWSAVAAQVAAMESRNQIKISDHDLVQHVLEESQIESREKR